LTTDFAQTVGGSGECNAFRVRTGEAIEVADVLRGLQQGDVIGLAVDID